MAPADEPGKEAETTPTKSTTLVACRGDVTGDDRNGDGVIAISDVAEIAALFNQHCG